MRYLTEENTFTLRQMNKGVNLSPKINKQGVLLISRGKNYCQRELGEGLLNNCLNGVVEIIIR